MTSTEKERRRIFNMRVLVIGASGFIGSYLVKRFSVSHDVMGTCLSKPWKGLVHMDMCDEASIAAVFSRFKPETVIIAAAVPNVDFCEQNNDVSYRVNVAGVRNVADACRKSGSKIVFFSTDYIFDGKSGPYDENAAPTPINYYGLNKLEGEGIVREVEKHLIVRTTIVYGWEQVSKNFADKFIKSLRAGQPFKVPTDQFGNPTYVENLTKAVQEMVEKDRQGIYNVSGSEYCNRYDFALRIAEIFNLDKKLVIGVTTAELNQPAKRPLRAGFKVEKFRRELSTKLLNIDEGLRLMKKAENA